MIPNSFPYYVFIRLSIWALRAVTPASIIYCLAWGLGHGFLFSPLEVLAFAEALFYFASASPDSGCLIDPVHNQSSEASGSDSSCLSAAGRAFQISSPSCACGSGVRPWTAFIVTTSRTFWHGGFCTKPRQLLATTMNLKPTCAGLRKL